jgi:predicted protein tyrosine phosphatase
MAVWRWRAPSALPILTRFTSWKRRVRASWEKNAGTDTRATTLEWALLHLVLDQEIQEKLYREIVEHVGKDGVITESDVEKMSYLNALSALLLHPLSLTLSFFLKKKKGVA